MLFLMDHRYFPDLLMDLYVDDYYGLKLEKNLFVAIFPSSTKILPLSIIVYFLLIAHLLRKTVLLNFRAIYCL